MQTQYVLHLFCFLFLTFLLEDGKKSLPIIPGISTTPGTMIYAGSIGTQIANEMLDFNRWGVLQLSSIEKENQETIITLISFIKYS